MEGAAPKSTSARQGHCLECAGKLHKLSAENLKLRHKLEEVAGRRDYYARLYYEALAELESYKRRIDFIVSDLEELGLTRADPVSSALLNNGLKEQVVGACDGFAHLPVQWVPDQHSIPLYRTSHLPTLRGSARSFHHCHFPGHHTDLLQASQSAPLLPQCPQGVHIPASRAQKAAQLHTILAQKCPSMPVHSKPWPQSEQQLPPRPPAPNPECYPCAACLSQKHFHSNQLRPQRSLDSACFCNGSDDSGSPICDEGHHSAFELLDPPTPYRALRQNSGRSRPVDPATSMGHSRASVAHSRRGTAPSQILKAKRSARRTCSDSEITTKRDMEVHEVDVNSTSTLYQKLSPRELNELSQFLATPECDITELGVADSQLCQTNMMEALCTGLKNNTSIKELSLPHNGLGWRSLEVLFGLLLKTPTSIRILRLCSNNISTDCFQALKDFLMDTDLELLDLRSNDITHNATRCKQLEEVRGNCRILFQAS